MIPEGEPKVLLWYRIYCALMVLLYVVSTVLGAVMMLFADRIANAQNPAVQFIIQGFVMAAMGSILAAAFFASFFLPRTPWAWVYHIVLISIGMTSCCCLPACVPLLIFWLKPETQSYFGKKQHSQQPPETAYKAHEQSREEPELPEIEVQPTGEHKTYQPEDDSDYPSS